MTGRSHSINKLFIALILLLIPATSAFGSTYLYAWNLSSIFNDTVRTAMQADCGATPLSACAVYSIQITPVGTAGTVVGSLAPDSTWTADFDSRSGYADATDTNPGGIRVIANPGILLPSSYGFTSWLGGIDHPVTGVTVIGTVPLSNRIGVYVNIDNPGAITTWTGSATYFGFNPDGTQRDLTLGKESSVNFEVGTQYVVPEPGTIMLAGVALLGLVARSRTRL